MEKDNREQIREVTEMLAGVFYPEELTAHYSYAPIFPKKFKEMERKYKDGEEIPKEWEEFFEFMEEKGDWQVPFSEYPEILKEWVLKGVKDTLEEADAKGVSWVTNELDDAVLFVKQKDGGYASVHLESLPSHPSFDDYQRVYFNELMPLQETLENASVSALLNEEAYKTHEGLFDLVVDSRQVAVGKEVREFLRFHRNLFHYGMKYPVKEEEAENVKNLLKEFPDAEFEDGEWKIKTGTLTSLGSKAFEVELKQLADRMRAFKERLEKAGLQGEVAAEVELPSGGVIEFSLDGAEDVISFARKVREVVEEENASELLSLLKEWFSPETIENLMEELGIDDIDDSPSP